ncbi:unnamed protein product, partial [Phaeothamnion confervicola]
IRPVAARDKDAFLYLVNQKTYPDSPATQVTGAMRQAANLEEYSQKWTDYLSQDDVRIFLAECPRGPLGFLFLVLDQKSGLTGEPQARILDHAGPPEVYPRLLEAALATCRVRRNLYITARAYVSMPGERALWKSLGFGPELTRVVAETAYENFEGPYAVRAASANDQMFIALLNARSTRFYMYANREDDVQTVATRNFEHYMALDFSNPARFRGVVVEDQDGPVGYVLLQNQWEMDVSRAPGSYVYDVAVDPGHRGGRAAMQVSRYAHSQVKHMGIGYIFGDVSLDNPRTLRWACRALGYKSDWERWG